MTTAKSKNSRNPLFVDEKYIGYEPVWDTEKALTMSKEDFDRHFVKSCHYYNYFYTQKDFKKHLLTWLKSEQLISPEDIKIVDRAKDKNISMTVCNIIAASRQGMPILERHKEFIKEKLLELVKYTKKEEAEEERLNPTKPAPYVPTIQERLAEKTAEQIGELEGVYDDIDDNPKLKFDVYNFLTKNKVPQSQLGKFEAVFLSYKAELELAQSKKDAQLTEGYKRYKAADFKRMLAFIDSILTAIEQYRAVKKAVKKVRAPRAISKEKIVSKLKYAKEDKTLKLVSIAPADIVGAKELWCYDTKTRKIIVYKADSLTGPLTVKGTSIVGFDESNSIAKTLRKPAEQLKEFMKASKTALKKYMDTIKTVETKASGRINENIVLLKVN